MRNQLAKLVTIALTVILLAAASLQAAPQSTTPSTSTTHKSTTKKKKSTHHHSARREPFQKAPTTDRISEIQSALSRGGYFEGDPNGKWDANTVGAMQKFQSANGLNSSGRIDAITLQKLGLGSSTAGVDAPKPIKKSDSNAASSASARSVTTSNASSASNVTPAPTPATAASAPKSQH